MFRSEKNAENLGVKEEPYWDFVEVDNYICPIFHNQINLGNNIFHHLLYYSNENIEYLLVNEDVEFEDLDGIFLQIAGTDTRSFSDQFIVSIISIAIKLKKTLRNRRILIKGGRT